MWIPHMTSAVTPAVPTTAHGKVFTGRLCDVWPSEEFDSSPGGRSMTNCRPQAAQIVSLPASESGIRARFPQSGQFVTTAIAPFRVWRASPFEDASEDRCIVIRSHSAGKSMHRHSLAEHSSRKTVDVLANSARKISPRNLDDCITIFQCRGIRANSQHCQRQPCPERSRASWRAVAFDEMINHNGIRGI